MLKNKFSYILIAIIPVAIIICVFALISYSSRGITLSINNKTDETISGLKIIYSSSNNNTEVPEILPKKMYKTKLLLPNNFTEGSIKIFYLDKLGNDHEEYLVDYIEKGYKEQINVTVNSVDENNVLSLQVNK
ncbi:hypothetical protein [Desulfitobacterium sp.]|uniref:hypothetical protein n=1 Tax=Desulfitobacterium sp. TaxID=49981 RepID=UPI002BE053D8|nr:hypothetical protein [Desulfitobacterium sp.]HVJ48635.1 hypothetical protein [Desulfitobacterium sp.]